MIAMNTACFIASFLVLGPQGSTPLQVQKLFSANGTYFDTFGSAVDIEGDRVAVGGKIGNRAWIYERGPSLWSEEATLLGPGVTAGDSFGCAVAISGDTVVVGAPRHQTPGIGETGAAFVFVQVSGAWTFQQKLTASLAQDFHRVGHDVAIEGDQIVLASFGAHAYVFERSGSVWSETQLLTLTDGGTASSVALDGGTLAVGSPTAAFPGFQRGAAYVYAHNGNSWQLSTILHPSTTNLTSGMGTVVRVSGDTLLATAWLENEPGVFDGAAYVFRKTGLAWTEEARLVSPLGATDVNFGWFGDIEGDRVAISECSGVPALEPNTSYLFERTGTQWSLVAPITPGPIECDGVVCQVPPALGDPWLIVGAAAANGVVPGTGAAFVYLFAEDTTTYCTGKVNSQGCVPQITWSGQPTVAGPDDFVVSASPVLPGKNGVFLFGTSGPAILPFLAATLCVNPPLKRSFVQQATQGAGCAGTISYLFSQADMAIAGLDPGETAHGQFWTRDPDQTDSTSSGLSNGGRNPDPAVRPDEFKNKAALREVSPRAAFVLRQLPLSFHVFSGVQGGSKLPLGCLAR